MHPGVTNLGVLTLTHPSGIAAEKQIQPSARWANEAAGRGAGAGAGGGRTSQRNLKCVCEFVWVCVCVGEDLLCLKARQQHSRGREALRRDHAL